MRRAKRRAVKSIATRTLPANNRHAVPHAMWDVWLGHHDALKMCFTFDTAMNLASIMREASAPPVELA